MSLALGLLGAAALVLFAPGLFGSKLLFGADTETLMLPFNQFIQTALAAGEWPVWMPSIYGGMPGLASANLNFLYPSELLLHYLPIEQGQALAINSALHCWLAGAGMLLFLRRLGVVGAAALLGAASFAWSGTLLSILYAGHVNNVKAIALIPWIFWGLDKGFKEEGWRGYAAAGIALGLQILAIGMQIYAYTLIAIAAYAAWYVFSQDKSKGNKVLLGLLFAVALSALISGPQLFPSLEYKGFSIRENFSYQNFISWSFEPKEVLTWIVPGFYGWRSPSYWGNWPFSLSTEYFGLLPWLLSAAALGSLWKNFKHAAWFFAALAALSFLIAVGKYTPLHQLFYHLPIYKGFRSWTRFLSLLTFSMSILAAFGFKSLIEDGNQMAKRSFLAAGALAAALSVGALVLAPSAVLEGALKLQSYGVAAGLLQTLAQNSAWHALGFLALIVVAVLVSPKLKGLAKAGLWLPLLFLGLHWFDMSGMQQRFLEWKNADQFYKKPASLSLLPQADPKKPWRILDLPGTFPQNQVMLHGYDSMLGYHGLPPAVSLKMQEALGQRQSDWFDLMGVKYILGRQELKAPWWKPMGAVDGIYVIENTRAFNRFHLVGEAQVVENEAQAYQSMKQPAWNPASVAVVEAGHALGAPVSTGLVTLETSSPANSQLKVTVAQEQFLVHAQNWFPGWSAKLDGKNIPIYKAQGGLMGVYIPAGEHTLQFHYQSRWLGIGIGAFFIGLFLSFWIFYREKIKV